MEHAEQIALLIMWRSILRSFDCFGNFKQIVLAQLEIIGKMPYNNYELKKSLTREHRIYNKSAGD